MERSIRAERNSRPMAKIYCAIANRSWIQQSPEMRAQSFTLLNVNLFNIFDRYSSLTKLKRIVATCRRFKTNYIASKTKSSLVHGPLSSWRTTKGDDCITEIASTRSIHQRVTQSSTRERNTFVQQNLSTQLIVDRDGLLRVDGRLKNAPLTYAQKHPILLSSHGTLTDLFETSIRTTSILVDSCSWLRFVKTIG